VPPGAVNAAQVAGKQDAWAKLPPAQRDELLQAFREEMPERWRKRLEAYFLSVAAEETKNADK
jgi:acyl-CoA reductase-like NAD-dependent aldehyde dehydrogenase